MVEGLNFALQYQGKNEGQATTKQMAMAMVYLQLTLLRFLICWCLCKL